MARASNAAATTFRPRSDVFRAGLLAVLTGGVPLFGVLYWLSISQGSWPRVLAMQLAVMAAAGLAALRFRAVKVRLDGDRVVEQGFFTRTGVPASEIASILIAHTYRSGASDTMPQFVAFGTDGARLFRLRGTFWRFDDMLTLAEALHAPLVVRAEPMVLRDFYALRPGIAYWYEGRPWLTALGIGLGFVLAGFTIAWLLTTVGIPVFGLG